MQSTDVLPGYSPDETRTLWVGQLPAEVTEASLLEAFAHEQLVSVQVAKDDRSTGNMGYGFLTFATRQAAQAFLLTFNGRSIAGPVPLKLRWASQESSSDSDVPDSHSLFVGDLPPEISDIQLQQHFQQYFPSATSAKVITDRLSGQSKGYGFIRFTSADERDRALSVMNGQKFGQQTIRVNRAKAKKYQGDGLYYPSDYDANNTTVFVGNVNTDITEDDLYSVFKRCGDVLSVKLLKAKGCAFITYAVRDAAERAINYLHGKVIKNSAVRLCWGRRSIYNSYPLPHPLVAAAQQQPMLGQVPHPSLQALSAQLGPPSYSTQSFMAPQQHYTAGALHPAQAYSSPNALSYQSQSYWRPDLQQENPNQPYGQQFGGQLGMDQALVPQRFLSQSVPNFSPGQALPRQVTQVPYLPGLGRGLRTANSLEIQPQYRAQAPPYTSLASRSAARAPRRDALAETEEVLAQLNLGSGPMRSSF